jgi:undecaprenyl-diphosphatase
LDVPFTGSRGGQIERAAGRGAHGSGEAWAAIRFALVGFGVVSVVLALLGLGLVHLDGLGRVREADETISVFVADRRNPVQDLFTEAFSLSAETLPVILVALVTEGVLAVRRRWRDLLLVPMGLGLEVTIFLLVNVIVARDRPAIEAIGTVPSTFSFPSGHTAATVVLCGSMVVLLRNGLRTRASQVCAWTVVALATVLVGYARVYRGMHHALDVVIGVGLGVACLLVAVVSTRASSLAQVSTGQPMTTTAACARSVRDEVEVLP